MTQQSLNISRKISRHILEVLEALSNIAVSLEISFFVCGALARDIILYNVFEIEIKRATEDVDFGVMVESWDEFGQLTKKMNQSEDYRKDKDPQRFYYKDDFPIDIVPFGKISKPDDIISWPDCDGVEMNTLGFDEAYGDSVTILLRQEPELIIKIASLRGLAAMKLISWKDRYPERSKDAKDFEYIARNYIDAGNLERVYSGEDSDILEIEDADYELMSARLMGRDVSVILNPESKDYILKILETETGEQKSYKFIEDMRQGNYINRDDFDERFKLLEAFKQGFVERL
ncbi:MAG: nucleotidyl transferase AbiEii/AbiGii toxin family protein [Thermodesulfobacteriota bacterium]|nr:nucleotidyl transferase AbiEii/AbiGii toxin family protein [Thermodesulfobacteriota bacterium]